TLFIKSNSEGGLATPSFRGTGASHTQVLWNGIPINSQLNGSADFSTIPVFFNDEIALLYGSASLGQGSGALGGSVSLKTTPEWGAKNKIELFQEVGSFGTYQTFLSATFANAKFASKTKAFYGQSANNYPYWNTANGSAYKTLERRQHADYQKSGILQEFYYKPKSTQQWALKVYGHQYFRHIPTPIIVNSNNGKEKEGGNSLKSVLEFSQVKMHAALDVSLAYLIDDMYYIDDRKMEKQKSKHQYQSFFLHGNYKYIFGKLSIKGGVQADYHFAKSNYYQALHSRLQIGIYAQADYQVVSRLRLYALLREELVDRKLQIPLPTLGLDYQLLQQERLFFKFSTSLNQHLPTLNDLYWQPGGNPNLKTEKSFAVEGGFSYAKSWQETWTLETDLTAYYSYINNWILWQPLNASVLWSPINLKEVMSSGLEAQLNVSYQFGPLIKNKRWKASEQAGYTFSRSINQKELFGGDQSVGKQLMYVPFHVLYSQTSVSSPWFYTSWQINFVGERFVNSSNTQSLAAYCLNDFSLGQNFKYKKWGFSVEAKITNIFNTTYESVPWQPMPGRGYHLYVKFSLFP
ncbi:MAG: TonB-dependent receptor plug domain-containing protein, partial [Bacteroidales bacterium]